jgi:hypothetical protein
MPGDFTATFAAWFAECGETVCPTPRARRGSRHLFKLSMRKTARASTAKLFNPDEIRRIAAKVAKLPEGC